MLNVRRLGLLLFAGILIFLCWWKVFAAADFTQRSFTQAEVPMQFMAPRASRKVPGVLIAHGFAGSKQLMLAYAHVLAHSGYGVLLWDLPGHGANTTPFKRETLQISFDTALTALKAQPEVDLQRLAVIGHSMGSGVAMTGGREHFPDIRAVIALSPTNAPITAETPKNLQLQAGAWEPSFITNAQRLLQSAGGENPDMETGQGRSLIIIPSVEHATILFSRISHEAVLEWLNKTFNLTRRSLYRDHRMQWYGIHLLSWLVVIGVVMPRIVPASTFPKFSPHPLRSWGGLLLAPAGAIATLKGMSLAGNIDALGGLLIGGAIGFWFFMAGLVWLGAIGKFPRPTFQTLKIGAIGFIFLWLGLGALAQFVWLPWFLTIPRLLLWGIVSLWCIPWFIAAGMAQQDCSWRQRLLWWFGQSVILVGGFIGTVAILPSLGFMVILLPVFPLLMGLFTFIVAKVHHPWSYAIACAPLLAWMIVTPFPMV
jgi:pimeloyl-ACP methyl ester carboxylesterase